MVKKLWQVSIVVAAITITEIILFAIHDFFNTAASLAVNGSQYSGNFAGLSPALESSPFWLMFLPPLIGIVVIILILRQPEGR